MAGERVLVLASALVLSLGAVPAFARSPVPSPSPSPEPLPASMHQDEYEKDFPLRSIGQLRVTNLRGGITVQGWALDKVRVKARRRAMVSTPEEAKRLFAALDFRYAKVEGDIELSAEYGRGLGIEERLRERQEPRTSMEMVVMAPASLKLRVWASEGSVTVKSWSGPLEIRTASGAIQVEGAKSDVSLMCADCRISAKNIRGSIRCMGASGDVDLRDVRGDQIYVESGAGAQMLSGIQGEQLFVSKSGSIRGRDLRGRIEFHSQQGDIEIREGAGFLSGRTESGNIDVRMRQWKFLDKALVESAKGKITFGLPSGFSGELDVWSVMGKVHLAFPIQPLRDERTFGPEPASHLRGQVGEGGEQLRVFSREGDIEIIKDVGKQ